MSHDDDKFIQQCEELGHIIINELLVRYPKRVSICVLPGVLAAASVALKVPRDQIVAMLDSALEDIKQPTSSE